MLWCPSCRRGHQTSSSPPRLAHKRLHQTSNNPHSVRPYISTPDQISNNTAQVSGVSRCPSRGLIMHASLNPSGAPIDPPCATAVCLFRSDDKTHRTTIAHETRCLPSHSGSTPSSILSGTPEAPSMFAAWLLSLPLVTFGLSATGVPGKFVMLVCSGDSFLMVPTPPAPCVVRGDAEALEALSEAPAECCELVRGETRPFSFAHRRPQLLHRSRCPLGPRRHSGVTRV